MSGPEMPHGPECIPQVCNAAEAATQRIAQLNSNILGTALDLAPAVLGVGLLVYGFRQMYKSTFQKIS